MKFTCSVDINAPVDEVVELFDDAENLQKWQPDLLGIEQVSGTPGEVGAVSKMRYRSGKQEFDLFETIAVKNLPEEFTGEYETKGVCWNTMKSRFTPLDDNRTRYDAELEYKLDGFMIKVIALIMPGAFKKQTQKHIERFRDFVEQEVQGG